MAQSRAFILGRVFAKEVVDRISRGQTHRRKYHQKQAQQHSQSAGCYG